MISDKEYKVIDIIHENSNYSQRDISEKAGFSLGLTNIILKKLIEKGFLKIKHFDKKRFLYLLTPRAISEKTKKSYKFVKKTIESISRMKTISIVEIEKKLKKGFTEFVIIGENELADIAEIAFNNLEGYNFKYIRLKQFKETDLENPVYIITGDDIKLNKKNCINIFNAVTKNI